jgi:nitrite reductase (NADH) small subunit
LARDKYRKTVYLVNMKIKICKDRDLIEGDVKTARVLARTIAVFRIEGVLYGLEADCKHMKASIARGKIEGHTITCPAHGWQYDVTTGNCLNEPWAQLKTYPVTVENEQIVIEISV